LRTAGCSTADVLRVDRNGLIATYPPRAGGFHTQLGTTRASDARLSVVAREAASSGD